VAYYLGIDSLREHRAMADASTTKQLLDSLLADLSDAGVSTLGDLIGVQGGQIRSPAQETVPLPPQIEEALRGEGQLELRYVSASGEETRRVVSPLHVTAFAGYLYLMAIRL
jgi:predicted DNA-binding transcriptional regulator YafY